MTETFVLFEKRDKVGLITLNRPEFLNALCKQLMTQLGDILKQCEQDPEVHCIVLTGSQKAFAAGADIKEMLDWPIENSDSEHFVTEEWEAISACRKPLIAAVSGYALGGGCEIALMCDMIVAGQSAKFSQPEVTIGTMPGAGGTQRLPRTIGKAKAMDMCLTGEMITAEQAEKAGLISRLVPDKQVLEKALEIAQLISTFSLPVIMKIKESIKQSFEIPLSEGLRLERKLFHSTFTLEDRKEGMGAFLEKRRPQFKNK